jgi:hypothetical protein
MTAMTTVLTESFPSSGNSRTYTQAGHTALKPQLVIQKCKIAGNGQSVAESTVSVLSATEDSDGAVLPQKVAFDVTVRYPIQGQQTDIDDMLAVVRDIIAGDEFANMVNTQEPLA